MIGEPIGRSKNNPIKTTAIRRFSIDERLEKAPPLDEAEHFFENDYELDSRRILVVSTIVCCLLLLAAYLL